MFPNPFESNSGKGKKEIQEKIDISSERYNEVIGKAKICLNSPMFQEYKKSYDKLAKELFEIFLDTPSTDPVTESLRVRLVAMQDLGIRVIEAVNLPERVLKP